MKECRCAGGSWPLDLLQSPIENPPAGEETGPTAEENPAPTCDENGGDDECEPSHRRRRAQGTHTDSEAIQQRRRVRAEPRRDVDVQLRERIVVNDVFGDTAEE